MRNRPDSRSRLAGLTPAGSPWPLPDDALPRPVPGDALRWPVPRDGLPPDDGWPSAAVDHWSAEPDGGGGWVPDVRRPPPDRRPLPSDDVVESPEDDDADHPPDRVPGHRAERVRYRPHHAWGRVAQRWVPEPLREARVDPGRRGALLLTVVAAVAALVAAVGVWRGQPEARPVQAVSLAQVSESTTAGGASVTGRTSPLRAATSPQTGSADRGAGAAGAAGGSTGVAGAAGGSTGVAGVAGTTGGGAAGATAAADGAGRPVTTGAEVLIVSVTGAVRYPGLVRLPPGSRVADAIAKAGGVIGTADLTGINLAARLSDGASVVVSDPPTGSSGSSVSGLGAGAVSGGAAGNGAPTATAGTGRPAGKVDLNTADAAALDALPGVGPVTAAAIVGWRDKNGRYTSVEQLQEIQGIGPAKYAALAPMVTV